MQNKQLWYTRRGMAVRGPFPAQQISRFILLGRIQDSDELSTDQHEWQKVSDIPVLIPKELQADLSDSEAHERLMIARLREDERNAHDRRDQDDDSDLEGRDYQRSGIERRSEEDGNIIRHRKIKTVITEAAQKHKHNYFLRAILAIFFVAGIIAAAWLFQPWRDQEADIIDCNASPKPMVNFSNCLMEGLVLTNTDLYGARMRNANLAGSDFSQSILDSSDLAYANMVNMKLTGATLERAALVGANLRNASLDDANLRNANMIYAILQGATLAGADLENADLTNADLYKADISSANISGAIFDNAIWIDGQICQAGSVGECRK